MEQAVRRTHWLSPLSIAGYVTWATMTWAVWRSSPVATFLPAETARAVALGGCALFLLAYLGLIVVGLRPRNCAPWLATQGVALLLIALGTRNGAAGVLAIMLAAELAAICTVRELLVSLAVLNLGLLAITVRIVGWEDALIGWASFVAFQGFSALSSRYAHQAEVAAARLAEANAELLATRALLVESARDQERLSLSRELHDVAGHKLTALKLNLAALARDPLLAGREQVTLSAQLADELLADIRGVVRQMRDRAGMDLAAAITRLASPFPRPEVHIEIAEDARVDHALKAEALLRTAQEALTNAARHADADHVWLVLRRHQDRIELAVRDDGRGAARSGGAGKASGAGSGLAGMRERLEALGGGLDIVPTGARGFALSAWLPAGAT